MSDKRYNAQEMREAADFFDRNAEAVRQKVLSNAILANIHEVIPMLRQAAAIREKCESLIKKHTVDKYAKCKKCRSAINGRPRSFRGEPCYWHIDCGLDEYHFRSGDTEDKIVRILKSILRCYAGKGVANG